MLRTKCRFIMLSLLLTSGSLANDWPYWRGPEQTGMTRENARVTSWPTNARELLWSSPVGGRTTPIVMSGRVYLIAPVGEDEHRGERVICLDANTGKTQWEHRFNVFHTDIVENRVGWTAVCGDPETGNIYAHGTGGELFCLSGDGDVRWKISLTEELGRISGYGGRLHTPVVDENRVVISFLNSSWGPQAKPTHRYLALDKRTGDILWWTAPGGKPLDTTYSVPVTAVIGGRRMLIAATADGNVYGMVARTGERVWTYRLSKRGLNASVVVDGERAYICHSEENLSNTKMGAVVCIDASRSGDITETGTVWRVDGLAVGYASPAIANGRIYVVANSANLICMDADTGTVHWEHSIGRVGKGSPTVTADGIIYVGEQNGTFHILKDAGDRCEALGSHSFERDDGLVDELFGSPSVANGRVYFMTRYGTYCLGSPAASPVVAETPAAPPESAAAEACLQVVPAEATVAPGEALKLRAVFASSGPHARPASDAKWSVTGVAGQVGPDGTFTASDRIAFSAGTVTAEAGGERAMARVRVSPRIPFSEDFEQLTTGSVPPGWIGCGKKVTIAELDGGKVLHKVADKRFPSPPFMRLRAYATPPIPGGCTVQCDVMGKLKKRRFKADMGVINTRYRLIALGQKKMLRVESWSPLPRIRVDVPFGYEPDKWYTMKFSVIIDGGQARLLGKIWPRDEAEPEAWTLDTIDPCPNLEGSAGLYAYSTNTTSKSDGPATYFDNFKVYANE